MLLLVIIKYFKLLFFLPCFKVLYESYTIIVAKKGKNKSYSKKDSFFLNSEITWHILFQVDNIDTTARQTFKNKIF